jgi:two-component system response regulator FlrC
MRNTPLPAVAEDTSTRELFHQLSETASPFVPHDEALLLIHDSDSAVLDSVVRPELVSDSGEPGEFRAWLRAPLVTHGEYLGSVAWLSRTPQPYGERELAALRAVADHVASALIARRHAAEAAQARDRAASLETSDALLREITDVLDIRGVFPRISSIVQRVLPHDVLTMTFHEEDGLVLLEASSDGRELPPFKVQVDPKQLARPVVVLPELTVEALERIGHGPAEVRTFLAASGFGSFMAVNVRARQQRLGLEFWAKQTHAFSSRDIPIAQRIADHVALAVSHEQLAHAAREIAESEGRARRLAARVKSLRAEIGARSGYARVLGRSRSWCEVLRAAEQVAATDTTVLLTGESGTGKEVIARLIHEQSARRAAPFVAVNCAALPEQLLESELFGFERGAFTGAVHSKPGQIELAAGGVLFLDEVSDMSPAAQAKFLRVLQEREFQRLGGTRAIQANVRVIAATNSDLQKAIERGEFRRDLYYRLRVFDIRLPTLRERPDDILPLAEAFLEQESVRCGRPVPPLSAAARTALAAHRWPGNVRELRNAIERAAILSDGGSIDPAHLSLDIEEPSHAVDTTDLSTVERSTIERVMKDTRGNKSQAARRLGLTRMQLYVRLRRYRLE